MPHSIMFMPNPYARIGKELAKHSKMLNNLDKDDTQTFAAKLVLDCPAKELRHFRNQINSLEKGTFSPVLINAFEIRQLIMGLANSENQNLMSFVQNEFNAKRFAEFPALAEHLFLENENRIAAHVAKALSAEKQDAVITILAGLFPKCSLKEKIASLNAQDSASSSSANAASSAENRYSFLGGLVGSTSPTQSLDDEKEEIDNPPQPAGLQ